MSVQDKFIWPWPSIKKTLPCPEGFQNSALTYNTNACPYVFARRYLKRNLNASRNSACPWTCPTFLWLLFCLIFMIQNDVVTIWLIERVVFSFLKKNDLCNTTEEFCATLFYFPETSSLSRLTEGAISETSVAEAACTLLRRESVGKCLVSHRTWPLMNFMTLVQWSLAVLKR